MPIYEYACDKCAHEFEVEQRITDEPVKTCPACRSRKVKRLISRTSFVLKGGGWYSDLYASPGAKKEAEATADKPDKPDKPGKSDKGEKAAPKEKSEAKPDKGGTKSKGGPKAAA